MPSKSPEQHRLMEAAAHTKGGYGGVPQAVGKEFVAADESPIAPHAGPFGRAAGIMFLTPDGETLLLRRGNGGDFPGTFGLPGGHLEEGETDEQAARREAEEETGFKYEGPLSRIQDDGQFVSFLAAGVAKFEVKICEESTGFTWCRPEEAPAPLHPGIDKSFRIAAAHTELDIARLIRDGDLPSPQLFFGSHFFALRISGTGHAFRSAHDEHVWRDPDNSLTAEFLARCNGLPVIWKHPTDDEGKTLNTKTFAERVIGTVLMTYIQGSEIWCIARIIDEPAAKRMSEVQLSTSPNYVFDEKSGNVKVPLVGDSPILIEGNPALIDHLAVCEAGVWDKGGPPVGVQVDKLIEEVSNMPQANGDTEVKAGEVSAADILAAIAAMGQSVAQRMDAVTARMDSMEKNMPAPTLSAASDRKDAEEEERKMKEAKDKKDSEEAEAKAKKDAEEEEEKEKARKDAEAKKAEEDCKMDADPEMYADAQARADSVYQLHSKSAPRPMEGEKLMAYRTRLVRAMQPHSDKWKAANLTAIADATAFSVAEAAIYADAAAASHNIGADAHGRLRAITRIDPDTGHRITTYAGKAGDWCSEFKAPAQMAADGQFHVQRKGAR